MRIVLGTHDFSSFAGTETYTHTLAVELQRLGHEAIVYASTVGPIADQAREQGIPVIDRLEGLPPTCDAVVSQDTSTAFVLTKRFPGAVRLQVVHSDYHALQSPPQLDGVCDAVVVLNDRVRRHVESLAHHPPIVRLGQPVDLRRFRGQREGQEQRTNRVLILGNYLHGPIAEVVTGACRDAGLEPVQAGVHTAPTATPEQLMADVDVVIGLGRCVIEAMACHRAAYVFGVMGSDGWVTPDSYPALEADGFAGSATTRCVDRRQMADDLRTWHAQMGLVNRQLAKSGHDIQRHAQELVAELRSHMAGDARPEPATASADELARLVRMEWQTWGRFTGSLAETTALHRAVADLDAARRDEVERLHQHYADVTSARESERAVHESELSAKERELSALRDAVARAEADRAAAHQQLAAFRSTRRYRSAMRLAAPLDAVRRRLGAS